MPPGPHKLSITIKLPLLFTALLLAVVSIFALLAYRHVSGVASADAVDRLTRVATQLSTLVSQQGAGLKAEASMLAGKSEVRAVLRDRSDAAIARAAATLALVRRDTSNHVAVEVYDRNHRLLAASPDLLAIATEAASAAFPWPDSASISPLYLFRDTLFFDASAPLPDSAGWVVARHVVFNSPQAVAQLSQLVGTDAQLFLGNREGPLWTDFLKRVDPPAIRDSGAVSLRDGEQRLGAFVPAPSTPWVLGAEFPLDVVLASTRAMLRHFFLLALHIVALGAVVGWLLSRQISRPLAELTRAAEDVASGRLEHLPRSERNDEIGRLSEAFRIMLDRVSAGKQTLRAVFDASPLPIVAMNKLEQVEFWNLAAERVFGWQAREVIGKRLPFIPDEKVPESDRLWKEAVNGHVLTGLDVLRKRRDGSLMDMRLTVSAIHNGAGHSTGVVAVYEDVTEQKRLEEHFRHIQRLDAVGRLAGGIAHDFNNLLTVILTEAELGMEVADLEERHDALHAVYDTALRAAALTRQLLAFARRQPLKLEVFDLGMLVADLEKMLRRLIGDQVALKTEIEEGLWPVQADRVQIEQVITNIVVNARDAMPNGGVVTVAARNQSLAPSDVAGNPELEAGDWILLSVTDTGSGMTDEVRSRVFEPFFTTKGPGKGTGLGLATCHGIVQQSGGRIQVESAPDKGTTISVRLPRATRTEETIDESGEILNDGSGGIILLVEDYSELRSATTRALMRAGYEVVAAESGEEALRHLGAGLRPDLMLSDIGLPGMNGVRLAEAARQIVPPLRVILVSGSKVYEHLLLAWADQVFLEKPYRVEDLIQRMRAVLRAPLPAVGSSPS
jgi:PAS domain S-box-containing protein